MMTVVVDMGGQDLAAPARRWPRFDHPGGGQIDSKICLSQSWDGPSQRQWPTRLRSTIHAFILFLKNLFFYST